MTTIREKYLKRLKKTLKSYPPSYLQQMELRYHRKPTTTKTVNYTRRSNIMKLSLIYLEAQGWSHQLHRTTSSRASDCRKDHVLSWYDVSLTWNRNRDLSLTYCQDFLREVWITGGFSTHLFHSDTILFKQLETVMTQNAISASLRVKTRAWQKRLSDGWPRGQQTTKKSFTGYPLHFVGKTIKRSRYAGCPFLSGMSYNTERIGDNATNIAQLPFIWWKENAKCLHN